MQIFYTDGPRVNLFLLVSSKIYLSWFLTHKNLLVDDLLHFSDIKDYEFFSNCDLDYLVETNEKTQYFSLCPYQVRANSELFSDCLYSVNIRITDPPQI